MISVVTPSFRQLDWLMLAIASIADQQGVDVQHIVQDGGTEDAHETFAKIAKSLEGNLYKPQLFVEKDQGMYDGINRGLKRATGEILAYLNCDEQYLPNTLQKITEYFADHPDINVLFGDAILISADGVPLSYRRVILPTLAHLRLADLNTLTCATFFRRRVIESGHFFPTHLKSAGDQYWVFQLLKAGIKMGVLRRPLSVFTFTGSNLSQTTAGSQEKFAWVPMEERTSAWLRPLVVTWHRLRKLFAGAYRWRKVTIDIYTQKKPDQRSSISECVGFRWPVKISDTYSTIQ